MSEIAHGITSILSRAADVVVKDAPAGDWLRERRA